MLQYIDQLVTQLRGKGAIGIEQYEVNLKNNAKNTAIHNDLSFEGRAALLFLTNGFKVTLRDSPDLKIELDNEVVYAEVKHFRKKEQDRRDEKAMSETRELLVEIGDTTATEGSAVYEQIANVAISKADQYVVNAPNILIIESSSDSTSLNLSSAAHEYNDRVRKTNDPRLRRLNALMLVNCCLCGFGNSGSYNTEFCPLAYIDIPMSRRLISTLFDIQLG
ncbi:MAG: hypothetical protein D4R82_00285 [Dehalococcoidia bacterium]|nr:MAG: hypothetical protein D4R82_00285 [Dehalococcoidia bacterium]